MRSYRLPFIKAVLLSGFALFALGFSHFAIGQPSMEGMPGHGMPSVQCQILCTTAIASEGQKQDFDILDELDDKAPVSILLAEVSLTLFAATFIVKRLHLLSSWRPPSRVLLYGHYSDGL